MIYGLENRTCVLVRLSTNYTIYLRLKQQTSPTKFDNTTSSKRDMQEYVHCFSTHSK
jgi:hypothetical protein